MDKATIALNRFGLGARPWDKAPGNPEAWLLGQMRGWDGRLQGAPTLASRADIVRAIADYREMIREAKTQPPAGAPATAAPLAPRPPAGAPAPAAPSAPEASTQANPRRDLRQQAGQFAREQYIAQVGARVRSAVLSDQPFAERLAHFWANHFAISADKMETLGLGGLMEFEAIRPHLFGKFEDMLLAVEQHPAMLLYLDQAQSVGPDSQLGIRAGARGRRVGLNENLGREILELHTLGVRTGYSQADVTELARALTGWTVSGLSRGPVARLSDPAAAPGDFLFAPALHQPGSRTVLGRTYAQDGEAQARAVLIDLARSRATARHLSTQLARHFVADDPPPALVARMESAYLASGGDLPAVYRALIGSPEAWKLSPAKFRDPWRWTLAALRAVSPAPGIVPPFQDRVINGALDQLGQPVWRPGSPAGYDDTAASWAAPDALLRRVDLAGQIAQKAPTTLDPRAAAERLFAGGLSPATAQSIARAESPQQGLALLLVSPEMLRC